MKPFPLLLVLLACCAGLTAAPAADQAPPGEVVVVPLDGPVTEAQYTFLRRALKNAEESKASAFVIDMDTPGGELGVTQKIVALLGKATMPTYTWINPNAASAGALIALGTKHIYMAPISAVGAAAPVMGTGADIPETMKLKATSYSSAYFRGVASQNGYDPNLVDAFMDEKKEFKIGDATISPSGSLLTLNAEEATKHYDGRRLLADGIAESLGELKQKAGLAGATMEMLPSGFERLALLITTLAPLFLMAGIAAAYMEFKAPGFGVAGFVSIACFAIFFLGHYIAGLTGFEVMTVFLLGALLVAIELVLFPGVLILAAMGTALMLGSLLFAMIDYFPGDPWIPSIEMLARPAINLSLTLLLSALAVMLLARFFPSLPFFNRILLSNGETAPAPAAAPAGGAAIGEVGVAHSILRPAGRAEFGDRLLDVVTDGEFLDPGTAVRIVEVHGSRVVVERHDSSL